MSAGTVAAALKLGPYRPQVRAELGDLALTHDESQLTEMLMSQTFAVDPPDEQARELRSRL